MTDATGYYGKLSSAQQDALNTMLTDFPLIAKENGLVEPSDLTLWGVSLAGIEGRNLTKPQTVVFLKYLRAKEFQAGAATTALVNTLKWRNEFKMTELMNETFTPQFTQLGELYGRDKTGHPVTYNYYGSIGQEEILNNPDTFLRWRVQLMERAITLLDFENDIETITQVHDYTGASMFMDKRLKTASSKIISLFQDHYPEMLEMKFFCGVPTFAEYLFNIMSSFVSSRTRSKFIVVGRGNTRRTLYEYINIDQLSSRYGGMEPVDESQAVDVKKITVPAWKAEVVEIPVKEGDEVIFEFAVVSMDIAFKIEVVPADAANISQPSSPTTESKGSIKALKEGKIRFFFDNSSSYFYEKNIIFRARVLSSTVHSATSGASNDPAATDAPTDSTETPATPAETETTSE